MDDVHRLMSQLEGTKVPSSTPNLLTPWLMDFKIYLPFLVNHRRPI